MASSESPRLSSSQTPVWSRRSLSLPPAGSSPAPRTHLDRIRQSASRLHRRALTTYTKLTPLQRVGGVIVGIACLVLGILFLIYNDRIFSWLTPYAKKWRDMRAGWLILWALTFIVSFPPLLGYSSCLAISGFVFGFPNGWFIVATATVAGSTCSFIASRTLLLPLVQRLLQHDTRFAALALTLKHDGLKLLIMIRLCPLPYSLSNGALATFPTVQWPAFALATAIVSPRLLLHVFVGAQLARIAEEGGTMDAKTRAISYASILIGVAAGAATGWLMYRKTKARAAELERLERAEAARLGVQGVRAEYADDPAALEAAEVVVREEEDDISLREPDEWEQFYGEEEEVEEEQHRGSRDSRYRDQVGNESEGLDEDARDLGENVFGAEDSEGEESKKRGAL